MVTRYITNLQAWLEVNCFSLNLSKTSYIIFKPINTRDSYSPRIYFGDVKLSEVTTQKFLGVWFHHNLSWNTHIAKLSTELSKAVGILYKISNIVPKWLKLSLYYACFYSRLSYCTLVWGTTTTTNYQKLLVIQKRALRAIESFYGEPKNFSTALIFSQYQLLKVNQVYYFKLLQYINVNRLYTHSVDLITSQYPFRSNKLYVPRARTNYMKQKLEYQIPTCLNKVSYDVRFGLSVQLFKKKTKKYVLDCDLCFN